MRWLLLLSLLLANACVQVLGGERSVIGDELACSDDDDCASKQHVCENEVCRQRCSSGSDCPAFRDCQGRACTDAVGTPCDPSDAFACNFGKCVDENANRDKVLGYCSIFCIDPEDCPADYSCVSLSCLED